MRASGIAVGSGQIAAVADRRVEARLSNRHYRYYVLTLLFVAYLVNAIDRSPVLAVSLQSIKNEFGLSDAQLGLLTGVPFALFYSTIGIPLAAWADRSSRRSLLALAIGVWSAMTALCGAAVNFGTLFLARAGTAIGEAGGSPPSHSLVSDYFPKGERGLAFSLLALGAPIGTSVGNYIAGQSVQALGWRSTFVLVGLPGILLALLVRATVTEPPRGFADGVAGSAATRTPPPPIMDAVRALWSRAAFRHLSLAAALHSVVWYASGAFNAAFLMRSHGMNAAQAGSWLTLFSAVGVLGTFLGGHAADRLSARTADRRWYLWVPAIATLGMVPFQFAAYLPSDRVVAFPFFAVMMLLAAVFFGPSFAMTQALAPLRMRSMATALVFFVQTLIGYGLGPLAAGRISDALLPTAGSDALRYALVIVGIANIWAAFHYFRGARTLRAELAQAEQDR
jgi:MFS family permease